jgi:hypothetical protein
LPTSMQPLDGIVGIGRTWWAQSSMTEFRMRGNRKLHLLIKTHSSNAATVFISKICK